MRSRRLAFTLIELLVVVAIISLLISILAPSLSRARQQAKGTVCMATLNEMYNEKDYSLTADFPVMRNLEDRFKFWVCRETPQQADTSGHYRVYEQAWRGGTLEGVRYRLPLIADANPEVVCPDDLLRSDIPTLHIAGLEGEAYVDERHYGGANFAFRDGHVERSTKLKDDLALDWDLDPTTPNSPDP